MLDSSLGDDVGVVGDGDGGTGGVVGGGVNSGGGDDGCQAATTCLSRRRIGRCRHPVAEYPL